ncbi:CLUMA_CG016059, isoform A [Clunio marinus]|uniref:CLUMA_CG016059, isoform A n=1 Tax=Clunio marinus TaxID=568069 RepID=A0A1J1IVU9_9DIPT|nr:CLUMA_CG016059, isoform A [Clunio marinus]
MALKVENRVELNQKQLKRNVICNKKKKIAKAKPQIDKLEPKQKSYRFAGSDLVNQPEYYQLRTRKAIISIDIDFDILFSRFSCCHCRFWFLMMSPCHG